MNNESVGQVTTERIVGVIGAGTMGAGIAHIAAQSGFVVETLDSSPDVVRKAYDGIRERVDSQVQKGRLPQHERDAIVGRLRVAEGFGCLKGAELVIEAAPEDLALKRKVLAEAEGVLDNGAVLATNTSSLSIAKLSEGLRRPERFIGIHFFNPAPVMNLTELIRGPQTSDHTLTLAVAFSNALGKTPIKVKDSPGFVVNRVARPFYLEALSLLESGFADVRTIDAAMREVGGYRMGPFELLDLIGLDVNLAVTTSVYEGFNRPARFAPSAIQKRLVEQGRVGRKTGRGFYDYSSNPPAIAFETSARSADAWTPGAAFAQFANVLGKPVDRAAYIYARIVAAVINEAARAAETIALPRDVDLGAKLGLNFPEGPMELADFAGLDIVLKLMQELHASDAAGRYEPAPLLIQRVQEGKLGEKSACGFLRHSL